MESKKEKTNASCKTRNQTPRQAQKNTRPRKRILPDQIETVPLRQRSGRARAQVRVFGKEAAEAAVSVVVDRADWCGIEAERVELQPVHPRVEEGGSGTGPQNSCRLGGAGCGGV